MSWRNHPDFKRFVGGAVGGAPVPGDGKITSTAGCSNRTRPSKRRKASPAPAALELGGVAQVSLRRERHRRAVELFVAVREAW